MHLDHHLMDFVNACNIYIYYRTLRNQLHISEIGMFLYALVIHNFFNLEIVQQYIIELV